VFKILKILTKYRKILLILFFTTTWIFSLWQLDLIRDLFIDQTILITRNNPELSHSEIFERVMWNTRFGFPPLSWFGIEFSLQMSFDLMYFLQAIILSIFASLYLREILTTNKLKKLLEQ